MMACRTYAVSDGDHSEIHSHVSKEIKLVQEPKKKGTHNISEAVNKFSKHKVCSMFNSE